jgi:adenylate cyclase
MIRPLLAGICIALLGVMISLSPGGLAFEENLGLDLLFRLRPATTPPDNILIVSIDRPESGRPKVSNILPREMYGELIDTLSARNARVIVLDLTFSEPGEPAADAVLAQAMHRAGNVILCEYLERQIFPAAEDHSVRDSSIRIEKRILPAPVFAENAVLTAPFPLPKIPVRLNRYWTFKKEA